MSEQKESMEWKKELDAVAELSDEEQMRVMTKILDEMDKYDEEEHIAILEELNSVSERMENCKQREDGKIVLNQASASKFKVWGMIIAIIGIGFSIWLGVSGSSALNILPFFIIAVFGIWLFGKGKFCQLVITSNELLYSSSFFGMKKKFMIADLSKVIYSEDGKTIKLYKDGRKVIAMKVDTGCEGEIDIPYFSEKGVEVKDQRPKIDCFKVRESTYRFFFGLFIIGIGVFWLWDGYDRTTYWSIELLVGVIIFLICSFFGIKAIINWKVSYFKVIGDEIYYKQAFKEEKRFLFSDITGYIFQKTKDGCRIKLYQGKEKFATISEYNSYLDLFVAKMNKMGIPCIGEEGTDSQQAFRFLDNVKKMERKIESGKGYLFRE